MPTEAALEGGGDVLAALRTADDSGPYVAERAVVARFPAAASPSLLYRALEGEAACSPSVLWQKDVPLELASGGVSHVADPVAARETGQFVLSGTVRNRNGEVLAEASKTFEVVSGSLAVTVATDATLYREGASVTVSGTLKNLGAADEPGAFFSLRVQSPSCRRQVHGESIALAGGETRSYSVTFVPAGLCSGDELGVIAEISSSSAFASERVELPDGDARPRRPLRCPRARGAARRGRARARSRPRRATSTRSLGATRTRSRGRCPSRSCWTACGTPASASPWTGSSSSSRKASPGRRVPVAAAWRARTGRRSSPASSRTSTRPIPASWDTGTTRRAPRIGRDGPSPRALWSSSGTRRGSSTTDHNRFQILLSEDGLARIDVDALSLPYFGAGCSQTGVSFPPGRVAAFDGPVALRPAGGGGGARSLPGLGPDPEQRDVRGNGVARLRAREWSEDHRDRDGCARRGTDRHVHRRGRHSDDLHVRAERGRFGFLREDHRTFGRVSWPGTRERRPSPPARRRCPSGSRRRGVSRDR